MFGIDVYFIMRLLLSLILCTVGSCEFSVLIVIDCNRSFYDDGAEMHV